MHLPRKWRILLLIMLSNLLVASLVALAALIKYSFVESECQVSGALQAKMRKSLSKAELESARSNTNFCPTIFFYEPDNGDKSSGGCAIGSEDIFRGPDISFGSCG